MVGVVCNLAEVLIVDTDINSDEERDEDDQSQKSAGARVRGQEFADTLHFTILHSKANRTGYQDIKYSKVLMLISTEMTRFFLIVATGKNWYEIKRLVITGLGKESIELNV